MTEEWQLIALGEVEAMQAAGHTTQDRWAVIAEVVAEVSGLPLPLVVVNLISFGFHPDLPEIADRGICEAIVDVTLEKLAPVVLARSADRTVH